MNKYMRLQRMLIIRYCKKTQKDKDAAAIEWIKLYAFEFRCRFGYLCK